MSILDLFKESNVINYFGKIINTQEIVVIEPIYFEKHETKIALYGFGYI
jgi:hypothetical protein